MHNISATILDKRGRVLSAAINSYTKSHPYQKQLAQQAGGEYVEKIYLHAEILAIIRCKDLSKAHKIVVTRVGKSGKMLLAKPCPICEAGIKAAGIKIIEHT